MTPARAVAAAKINLALVVGPRREDGLHDVVSVMQRIDLCDRIELTPGDRLAVEGFDDTIVGLALTRLATAAVLGRPNPPASSAGVSTRGSCNSANGLPRVSATMRSRTCTSSGPRIADARIRWESRSPRP